MVTRVLRRRELLGQPSGWSDDVSDVIQRIYAARGVLNPTQIEHRLAKLLNPSLLGGIEQAVKILADAIIAQKRINVAGDYDCDGATGAAVAYRGLRMLGAQHVSFTVPDRFVHGYGLTPALIESMHPVPELIVTVDSGTSSYEGVAHAKAKGMQVVVTDHHLPGDHLPEADAIVNPNLNGDGFPSKMLAGVGVMFYVLMALRKVLRDHFKWEKDPDLTTLLDLVAVGTVADLVPLDYNNRILVDAGLRRIRNGQAHAGVRALIAISGRSEENLAASDIGFAVAPRLNAAGRLENMKLGVETLITDDPEQADKFVTQLDGINKERKDLQAEMVMDAEALVAKADASTTAVVVYDPSWHAGVVGLVASKLKESLHRPVFAFAAAGENSEEVRGSGRSIPGFHLRDALALVEARHPGLMLKFGGHAMAAGMSLRTTDIPTFSKVFNEIAEELLSEDQLNALIYSDGELEPHEINIETAQELRYAGPWGQGFPEPAFDNVFNVKAWVAISERHLKLLLEVPNTRLTYDAMYFFGYTGQVPPGKIRAVYGLNVNQWQERESLQLNIQHYTAVT